MTTSNGPRWDDRHTRQHKRFAADLRRAREALRRSAPARARFRALYRRHQTRRRIGKPHISRESCAVLAARASR